MGVANGNGRRAERLKSWKEVAAFFGTDERTVRRWEERGLPVHRVPGGGRPTIYAEVAELQAWLQQSPAPAAEAPTLTPSRHRWRLAAAAGAVLLFASGGAGLWLSSHATPAPSERHRPSPAARNLYQSGTYESDRMTLQSLRRAVSLFGRAVAEDPTYAESYAGLANAWLRLRPFGTVSEVEADQRARAAAERALELDSNLPQAHATMGFIKFYRDWDFAGGLEHFQRVSELDPRTAAGRHSYGMALLHVGRFREALAELDAAQHLDPRSRARRAEDGIALYLAGHRAEGKALLQSMAAEEPDFIQPYRFLTMIELGEGNYRAGLDHATSVARLSQDQSEAALVLAEKRALESEGPAAMMQVLLQRRSEMRRAGQASAYAMAEIHALNGDRAAALRDLRESIEAREPEVLMMRIDPMLNRLHGSEEFEQLSARLGFPG